ncbi:MAG TPA: NADH-ubiquinone oxidoreductase-F iron-sulfur binding region domain-containing protein [Thermodesulfovibrionales bacterium]|nr:NADH-ubiquinone oxidoreductase-F iron-sulfur binding region domain-containing protein [Thermodesulfovibrionales bacterium]
MENYRVSIMLCGGTGCTAAGSLKIRQTLKDEIKSRGLSSEINILLTACNGFCAQGPVMIVYPDKVFYQKVSMADVPIIVEEHLIKGRPVERLMYKEPVKKLPLPGIQDIPFFNLQVLRALRNKGMIDPEKIDEYIARDGYQAAAKALTEMTPERIIHEIKMSGLRGRGGAGIPTGIKWEICAKADSDSKYIICNRSTIEVEPHIVIEGMIIGAKAIGAHKGYVYVRTGYPIVIHRLNIAITEAREYGLLGENILGTGFDFDIELAKSADEFVCGEETALLMSIESKRGMPNPRPPYPVEKGLWDEPTVINTVETFANIPQIILQGAEWYRSVGTEKSPGTKIFTLSGPLNNTGLIEVPMGISLSSIINDIGGGMEKGRRLKAVQVGGSTGGYIPEHLLDVPVTYEDVTKLGAIVGSGGIAVMSDLNCMVSAAKFVFEFASDESCGKCPPCRLGTKVLLDKLKGITEGRGEEGDIEVMEDLALEVKETSLCGLGQTAMNPVLSSIRYFREEYDSHIRDLWCKAGVCRDLCTFFIEGEKCKGCGACARACPRKAISGEKKQPHRIDQALCIQCRSCYETCKFGSIGIGPRSMREELLCVQTEAAGREE